MEKQERYSQKDQVECGQDDHFCRRYIDAKINAHSGRLGQGLE